MLTTARARPTVPFCAILQNIVSHACGGMLLATWLRRLFVPFYLVSKVLSHFFGLFRPQIALPGSEQRFTVQLNPTPRWPDLMTLHCPTNRLFFSSSLFSAHVSPAAVSSANAGTALDAGGWQVMTSTFVVAAILAWYGLVFVFPDLGARLARRCQQRQC